MRDTFEPKVSPLIMMMPRQLKTISKCAKRWYFFGCDIPYWYVGLQHFMERITKNTLPQKASNLVLSKKSLMYIQVSRSRVNVKYQAFSHVLGKGV